MIYITFPQFSFQNVNMMPIIMGDISSVPESLQAYTPIIDLCHFRSGSTVYLTVTESIVEKGKTQRRPGIHTDATKNQNWGGGWGGKKIDRSGIFMASSDGRCRLWDEDTTDVDTHGGLLQSPKGECILMKPNELYLMNDTTPHESLPALVTGPRQFFRLVSEDVGVWFSRHSTANPLGVTPSCQVVDENKFELLNIHSENNIVGL